MYRYGNASKQNTLRTGHPLTNDQIYRVAPSVFASEAHHSRSDSYGYMPTVEILNDLRSEGFEVMEVRQSLTRSADKRPFTKHMVRMQHRSVLASKEAAPEIMLINSHDGSSAYNIMSGVFRFVCSNGLIAGDMYENVKVQHRSNIRGLVIDGCTRVLEDTKSISQTMQDWMGITMTEEERVAFAGAALKLRWDDKAPIAAHRVLSFSRWDDRGLDLWKTFNVVQENLVKGGQSGRASTGRRLTTREVTGIDQTVGINRGLWNLAQEFADAKANQAAADFVGRYEHAFA